nr:unnamed protein product [Callosobruchus analis]
MQLKELVSGLEQNCDGIFLKHKSHIESSGSSFSYVGKCCWFNIRARKKPSPWWTRNKNIVIIAKEIIHAQAFLMGLVVSSLMQPALQEIHV